MDFHIWYNVGSRQGYQMRERSEYHHKLLVAVPQGSLIDLETTGRDALNDEIITFGYIRRNVLRIIQRKSTEGEQIFIKRVKPILKGLPQPFYAYNAKFEHDFIRSKFKITAKFMDLMEQWRKKAEKTSCPHCKGKGIVSGGICEYCRGWRRIKWPGLGDLISEPGEYFGEKVIQGKDVPDLWDKYRETKDLNKYLLPIIQHCRIDLLRELILLIHFG